MEDKQRNKTEDKKQRGRKGKRIFKENSQRRSSFEERKLSVSIEEG
jgi:hypothetical protein